MSLLKDLKVVNSKEIAALLKKALSLVNFAKSEKVGERSVTMDSQAINDKVSERIIGLSEKDHAEVASINQAESEKAMRRKRAVSSDNVDGIVGIGERMMTDKAALNGETASIGQKNSEGVVDVTERILNAIDNSQVADVVNEKVKRVLRALNDNDDETVDISERMLTSNTESETINQRRRRAISEKAQVNVAVGERMANTISERMLANDAVSANSVLGISERTMTPMNAMDLEIE